MRLLFLACLALSSSFAQAQVPREAVAYRDDIARAAQYYWGLDAPTAVFFAQIHQESRFKSAAQSTHAFGLAQFTISTADWIRDLYPADLSCEGLCAMDPAWAIRAMLIYDRRLYDAYPKPKVDERLAFMLSAYNGGARHLNRERALCERAIGPAWPSAREGDAHKWHCNKERYFGHVQAMCGASGRAAWACRENTDYPEKILHRWTPLYTDWLRF